MSRRTLIIAEAGVNHNGDFALAKKLVDAAVAAGADLVKFQTFSADRLVTQNAPKAEYQAQAIGDTQSQFAMLKKLELSPQMHQDLISYCHSKNIDFFSTGFDIESLNYLSLAGLDRFKIPSGEITNLPYLRHVGAFGKSVIISTGMATLGEIEAALDVLESAGTPRSCITVLHCNTEYPTPMQDVNLRAMCSIRDAFGVEVGYSDHTAGIEVPIAAVALGATVIEKHLTLDRNLPGPDHMASLEPDEFAAMVSAIRNIEQAMGDGIKRPSPSELKNKPIARKSLVAARAIQEGEVFTPDNVTTKRPGMGVSPMRWDEVIGRTALRDFLADELITL
ncbi:N-acetylneuraminate synthase [Ectothiorhodosinus mongolicus]|uniref:N-acetylneuraminate synthase n=1 Tax=Ectothiorhodosinus mongolicus TaxID=233100 RepID=A0A1R3VTW9_9GAMM|nr:N-acetylneuraminate synthase [Ectothiorhodosinus mongolicus]ULX56805.1 N-acetylneuraminate synthase [Ectothiorhodosinus mongolicus]SIT68397.1 N-acetylneuraminate synthase [Ectothiorhodosinus mongolicus]